MTVREDQEGGVWAAAVATSAGRAAAPLRHLRHPVILGEVTSTQDELRALALAGAPAGTVVIAERQVQGRGRIGRPWSDSPRAGASLALSFLVDLPATGAQLLPHAVGLGVVTALEPFGLVGRVALKWPNDVVVEVVPGAPLRKLAGTLVEGERIAGREVALVGLGVNVDRRDEEQPAAWTCLASSTERPVDAAELLARLLPALDAALELLGAPDDLLAAYRDRCVTIGRRVVVEQPGAATLVGTAEDVDAYGRLEVATAGGRVHVLAGTVRDAPSLADPGERGEGNSGEGGAR